MRTPLKILTPLMTCHQPFVIQQHSLFLQSFPKEKMDSFFYFFFRVSVSRRTFGPSNVTVYVWFAATSSLTKCIWSMAISQHQFFIDRRLNKVFFYFKTKFKLISPLLVIVFSYFATKSGRHYKSVGGKSSTFKHSAQYSFFSVDIIDKHVAILLKQFIEYCSFGSFFVRIIITCFIESILRSM